MNRLIIAIAAALIAAPMLFASAAQACISCNYVPEVARTPAPTQPMSRGYSYKRYYSKDVYSKAAPSRATPSQRRVVKNPPLAPRKIDTAKADRGKATTTSDGQDDETSRADASVSSTDTASASTESAVSSTDGDAKPTDGAKVAEGSKGSPGCVKFFPAIGKTVAVPCE